MHVANPSLGFHFPAPNAALQDAEGPVGVGRAHYPAASRAHGLRPQGQALAHTFELSFFLMGCKYRSQYPSQKVRTQENLLSIRTAFGRAGSAAESTFNLLSNYIMEQGTNYCLFPALLKASFTGFILPRNHFSSSTVFQLKSHFWKCLHPNDNSNKIYYT